MGAVFGRKSQLVVPGRSGVGDAGRARHPTSWSDKAGPQHRSIAERIGQFICDTHSDERGLHVPSALGSIGRLVGFAAQYVVWKKATGSIDPCAEACTALERELAVALVLGRPHAFAAQVEAYLVPAADHRLAPHGSTECLLSIAGEAVTAAGRRPMAAEAVHEIIDAVRLQSSQAAVVTTTGVHGDDFSLCQWPLVKNLLEGFEDVDGSRRACAPLAPVYWPLLLAEVAARMIGEAGGVLDSAVALRLVMEAAVPASMLNPKDLPATVEAAHALARSRRELAVRRYA
jgi:hypothetical protein